MPLIHIGYHKTGSTLLQQRLFDLEELGFVRLRNDRQRLQEVFVQRGPYDLVSPQAISELQSEEKEARDRGLCLVISHERLSGYPATGGYDARLIADRLFSVFPDAKVLIGIREQRSIIRSYYLQYIDDGGDLPFSRLVTDPQPHHRRAPIFDFEHFAFDKAVRYYKGLFGSENVLTYAFEQLKSEPVELAKRIVDFGGQASNAAKISDQVFSDQVNPARPMIVQVLRRWSNGPFFRSHLSNRGVVNIGNLPSAFRYLSRLLSAASMFDGWFDRRLRAEIDMAIRGRYEDSNARLCRETGLDLGALGYSLPPSEQERPAAR